MLPDKSPREVGHLEEVEGALAAGWTDNDETWRLRSYRSIQRIARCAMLRAFDLCRGNVELLSFIEGGLSLGLKVLASAEPTESIYFNSS